MAKDSEIDRWTREMSRQIVGENERRGGIGHTIRNTNTKAKREKKKKREREKKCNQNKQLNPILNSIAVLRVVYKPRTDTDVGGKQTKECK